MTPLAKFDPDTEAMRRSISHILEHAPVMHLTLREVISTLRLIRLHASLADRQYGDVYVITTTCACSTATIPTSSWHCCWSVNSVTSSWAPSVAGCASAVLPTTGARWPRTARLSPPSHLSARTAATMAVAGYLHRTSPHSANGSWPPQRIPKLND